MNSEIYDVIVIGGGPAGLTASLFTSRAGLKTLLLTEEMGGLMLWTEEIDNYPGVSKVNSRELMNRMVEQTKSFGTEIVKSTGKKINRVGEGRIEVVTNIGKFEGKSLIIASGLKHRKLGVEGESLPGVSYCAVCDGPLYEGMDVCVVGSGDSAIVDALFLSRIAKGVSIVVPGARAHASEHLIKKIFAKENVKFIWHSAVDKILGEKVVEGIQLKDLQIGEIKKLPVDAIFIKVGLLPRTDFLEGFVDLTGEKFVKVTDERTLETSQEGVFVAGDVRDKLQRQIASAVGDGCLAAESVFRYLEEQDYLRKIFESEKIVIASFWDSSIPKSSQAMILRELEKKLGEKIETIEIDRYKMKKMASRFEIKEVPTIFVMKKKEILDRVSGEVHYDKLIEKIQVLNDPEELFQGKKGLVEVDEKNYEIEVLGSRKPVVVEFWGPRCKDCIEMAPTIYKISEEYSEKVKFCYFRCPSRYAVLELGVRNLPTFYFYKDGNLIKSLIKEDAKPEKVKEVLETIISSSPSF